MVVWLTLEGCFWYPRTLFGIEDHLYAFYDQPDLMKEMNEDLLAFNQRIYDEFCEICVPDFMTFAEDMSYNHGPMLSKGQFDEFMAPFYRANRADDAASEGRSFWWTPTETSPSPPRGSSKSAARACCRWSEWREWTCPS